MRVARGACWVIVAALLGAAALALLDAALRLPGWVRGLGLAVWLTALGVLAWRLVVRRLPADSPDDPSPQPKEELPGNLQAAVAATLALAASLLAATLVPGVGEHIRRVALPWSRPAAAPYRVVVTSGEPVVRRGGPVTLSAYADKIDQSAPTPDAATLVCRDRGGNESRFPMTGDASGAFHASRATVVTDFEYRIEIGTATSDWLTVFAVDAADATPESSIEVSAPKYAPATTKRTFRGFVPFEGFQHGTAELRLRFTRPAATAFLEWRADGNGPVEVNNLDLSADRQSGTAALRLKQNGTLKLVTVAEQDGKTLRTELPVRVRVTPDLPPRFEQMTGLSPRPRTARPATTVAIEFAVADDIAIGSALLEYVVGPSDANVTSVPIPLSGTDTPRADGRFDFDLTGKAREGETIRFRIRLADTRRLDDPDLKPQETVYPATRWSTIRLDAAAPPLAEQDILAQRDTIRDGLHSALDEIKQAREEVGKVRRDSAGKTSLAPDHTVRLSNARDHTRKVAALVSDAAREAALRPALAPLARDTGAAVRPCEVADQSLVNATTADATGRESALGSVFEHFAEVEHRLRDSLARNDRLAQARLDGTRIATLAADQAALANLAKGNTPPEELARLQRDLLARLHKLVAESEPLRGAVDAAKEKEFRRLVATAIQLAGMVRDLDAAVKQLDADTRNGLLAAITADQVALATTAAALLSKIETAARLAQVAPPKADHFTRVSKLIAAGKTVEALTELEALARGLDETAAGFEKWATDRTDLKAAARQLALWQDDLGVRFRTATAGNSASFDTLPAATKSAFRTEQAAIRAAVGAMKLPPGDDIKAARGRALTHLDTAASFLAGTGAKADEAMTFSAEAVNSLAGRLPTIPERLTKTRAEFARVLQEQDSILVTVERTVRGPDPAKKLPPLADRQRKQIAAFAALDIPGLDVRKSRIAVALAAAAADLKDGSPADALASQAWVKREFDRLKLVLDGYPSPDDRADELARKVDEIAKAVEALGPTPTEKQLEPHAARMQDLLKQFGQFQIPPESPSLFNDTEGAIRAAEAAFRDNKLKAGELARRLRAAADALAKLADRLNGAESDRDRVRRLASNRRATVAAEEARRLAKAEPAPDAPADVARQLGREIEELSFTRVGAAGQALKKKVLDQYTRLKDHMFPDRQAGLHKALAEALDELATLMANVPELTKGFDRTLPAAAPTDADAYLPSKPLADSLHELARRQRALRDRVTGVPAEVVKLVKPADSNPIGGVEKAQRELAAEITFFARKLEADVDATVAATALEAAINATLAADGLANGVILPARGSAEVAATQLRQLATSGRTKPWGKPAAGFATRQDTLIAEMKKLPATPGVAAAQQKVRGEQLARKVAELAQQLELAAQQLEAADGAKPLLQEAVAKAKAAEKLIADAAGKTADGNPDAAKLRATAAETLQEISEKIAGALPAVPTPADADPAAANAADALRRAESTVRQALGELGANSDRAVIEKSMRMAAEALGVAAKARTETLSERK
jgi:hypothetical protein